eukprot:80946_1
MASSNEPMSRSQPFLNTKWLSNYLPFNPTNSTFSECQKGEQLYELIGDYIVKHSDQSYRFSPKKNVSKATRTLENLARIAKQHKDSKKLSDDEKKEADRINEEIMKSEQEKSNQKATISLGLGLHEFVFDDIKFYAIHQAIGAPVGGSYCSNPLIFQSIILFVEGRG